MRSNKFILFSIFFTSVALNTNAALYPNPSLGFPSRNQSVANAVYSAIELSVVAFPFEHIAEETALMKYKIWMQSRRQLEDTVPGAEFGYKKPGKYEV